MALLRKSVLITGCSAGGIGAALAEVFHEKGYHVFAALRDLSKTPQALSGAANVTQLTLDVLSSESIAAAVDSVKRETGGRLDVLVNNSGGGYITPALDASIDEGKKLFDLNFWAPLAVLQAFAPLLISAKGCVVNNSSANAFLPLPLMSIYGASKAALATASETWRHELQPLGVRTITLVTCAVKTNFFNNYHAVKLPETSNYLEIQDFVHSISDGRLQDNAITPRQYAIKVARKVENGTAGLAWVGTDSFFARLANWLLPQSVLDSVVGGVIPLSNEMAKAAQKRA